ncbi:hypothetical protein [Solimicrobium silvestre]|uniref:Uncharacterized protein n=1 Tax=Solimicrobium silvestre TaxID=2099400 RepID=A0A2S9GTX5_9BURK|nr:hypothetical protein [Solimicrobium silvestre]PRC91160.1 hypothetical protein S2091_4161 [Solimicrobium silvestre]
MAIRDLHRISALMIAAYAALHVTNHIVGIGGAVSHINFMEAIRPIYRQPVIEAVLLFCVMFQVGSGLFLAIRGWKQRHGLIPWVQAASGMYLAFFLVVHVSAVLLGRAVLKLDTNFYFAAAGFYETPYKFFFAPYYFFAIFALFTHLGCAAYWQVQARPTLVRALTVLIPAGCGLVISLFIVLSLAGVLHPVEIPAEYKATYELK